MLIIGTFIIKFVYKSKPPKIEMPISKNNKEGEIIQPDIKTHFKVTIINIVDIITIWIRGTEQRPGIRPEHLIYDTEETTEH